MLAEPEDGNRYTACGDLLQRLAEGLAVRGGDEEPTEAKSSVPDEEPKSASSVNRLAAEAHIYALKGAERGSL